ncbi:MAG: hydrogenase maturation protease [Chloroflexota bacterium]
MAIPWPVTSEGPVRNPSAAPPAKVLPLEAASRPSRTDPRVLVAGVGYRNLRDMSAGPELIERLRAREWASGVQIEDLSFGAVHVLHWLQERSPFDALILCASVARGRAPGSVTRVAWSAPPTTGEAVQAAIAEAVTGVISLDTLLTVLGYFAALPARVVVIEVEPRDDDWGAEFSPLVAAALEESVRVIISEVEACLAL